MRIYVSVIAALGSVGLMATSSTAIAGGCGYGATAPRCDAGVVVTQSPARFDPMTVQIQQPMGHLKSINFQRSPNVSITRIHGMGPSAGIADAPSGFTGGCHPGTTQYCRGQAGTPVNVTFSPAPVAPAPIVHAPVMHAPRVQAPRVQAPVIDMSKYQPRQYGSVEMSHGTALVPTSIVDRNPAHAQAALDSGRTVPQAIASGGMAPGYSAHAMQTSTQSLSVMQAPAAMRAPEMSASAPTMRPYISPPVGVQGNAPVQAAPGFNASPVANDGSYWEQVSGPTLFGDTIATKVVCKRQLPRRVVNPVVGVPVVVPIHAGCVQQPAHAPVQAPAYGLAGGPVHAPAMQAPAMQAPVMEDWSY